MGYVRHHAIVVTSWNGDEIIKAHAKAVAIFGTIVTPVLKGNINEYETFFVGPDGSKEGWDESDEGDRRRDEFIAWLETQRYSDESSWLAWAELFYGDDNQETRVTRDADAIRRAENR